MAKLVVRMACLCCSTPLMHNAYLILSCRPWPSSLASVRSDACGKKAMMQCRQSQKMCTLHATASLFLSASETLTATSSPIQLCCDLSTLLGTTLVRMVCMSVCRAGDGHHGSAVSAGTVHEGLEAAGDTGKQRGSYSHSLLTGAVCPSLRQWVSYIRNCSCGCSTSLCVPLPCS